SERVRGQVGNSRIRRLMFATTLQHLKGIHGLGAPFTTSMGALAVGVPFVREITVSVAHRTPVPRANPHGRVITGGAIRPPSRATRSARARRRNYQARV